MNEVRASAPGKVVLLGEYAVLEGAPALALAVDRRAKVRLRQRGDGQILIRAPQIGVDNAKATLDLQRRLHWDQDMDQRLHLIEQIWSALAARGWLESLHGGFELEIDTAGFVFGASKLGLGSSAALSVALAAALLTAAGHEAHLQDRAVCLQDLVQMHRAWQGGQGSGIDIAASLQGGAIVYQLETTGKPVAKPASYWPPAGLCWQFIWSGHAVSTGSQLRQLVQWRDAASAVYRQQMQVLGEAAQAAIKALALSASKFLPAVADYAVALQAFSQVSGLEIYSPSQRELALQAARIGAVFKPCGAGGDLGVVFADDPGKLEMLHRSIIATGPQPLSLMPDLQGLLLERTGSGP